ncbi:MAG: response regulator [Alphaproteobacteria bacterium]|uniref:Response regulator n=1 Tax=Candidatus Nitrobium versatile TaxID=2884831 RepID=A0A953SHR3_9BACT|nr:response regulator [Candidatus Nitrobium versatile]
MSGKVKILVIEDNPANRELFIDLLTVGGYECIGTDKGEEALDLAKRESPELVLLDIQLPGVDGLTVVKLLKAEEETKHIKVIALTAYAMKGDRERFLKEGFDGYISKPVMVKEFLEAIKKYLEG